MFALSLLFPFPSIFPLFTLLFGFLFQPIYTVESSNTVTLYCSVQFLPAIYFTNFSSFAVFLSYKFLQNYNRVFESFPFVPPPSTFPPPPSPPFPSYRALAPLHSKSLCKKGHVPRGAENNKPTKLGGGHKRKRCELVFQHSYSDLY